MAYCRTKATIEEAIQEGVIDIALEERDDRFADCDYIFLCAPVSTNISYLPFVKGIAKPVRYTEEYRLLRKISRLFDESRYMERRSQKRGLKLLKKIEDTILNNQQESV